MDYRIGKLKDFIYLIKDLKVKQNSIIGGEVFRLDAAGVSLVEQETYSGRFKFNSTITCMLTRLFDDSFFRESNYAVVVEDDLGNQFLIGEEFDTLFDYELTITDLISAKLTFTRQSNYPVKKLSNKIVQTNTTECRYSGLGIKELYVGDEKIDYLTIEFIKNYVGEIKLTFTDYLDKPYDFIKFPNNIYDVKLVTYEGDVFAYSLFPSYSVNGVIVSYTLTTSNPSSGFSGNSGQSLVLYRWVTVEGYICNGFNKYTKENREQYVNGAWKGLNEFRAGQLIEENSSECGQSTQTYRWITDGEICGGVHKYVKEKQQILREGEWTDTGKFRQGALIEANSIDCGYMVVEWREVPLEYICDEYEPIVTWKALEDQFYCEVKTI